jgi:tryptophan 7-halogenase
MIKNIAVLGGGSAGFLAAITLRRRVAGPEVTVIRSPEIGIIGVGEGTTPYVPTHLTDYLGLREDQIFREAQPIWKLGIKSLWGPRPSFNFTFRKQLNFRYKDLPKDNGYYFDDDMEGAELSSAFMDANKVFLRQKNGSPDVKRGHAWHLENEKLVRYLEARARDFGVKIVDATVQEVQQGDSGVTGLVLDNGETVRADLFIDASGFRSVLLGQTLGEPFQPFTDSLFCDRAVVGGWKREDEPIQPYTVAETMDAGWSWRIDHEETINRGYVYSSGFMDDTAAEAEFRAKNPKVASTRIVKYRTGRYRHSWVKNVVAIGNSAGFVEPLEATALLVICMESRALADTLTQLDASPTPTARQLYNTYVGRVWDDIRDFLAVHYRFNTRLDTSFWQHCRNHTALHGAEPIVRFYQENGPTTLPQAILVPTESPFGLDGYLTYLVGQQVPHKKRHTPSAQERAFWAKLRQQLTGLSSQAVDVKETLKAIRSPSWSWSSAPAK